MVILLYYYNKWDWRGCSFGFGFSHGMGKKVRSPSTCKRSLNPGKLGHIQIQKHWPLIQRSWNALNPGKHKCSLPCHWPLGWGVVCDIGMGKGRSRTSPLGSVCASLACVVHTPHLRRREERWSRLYNISALLLCVIWYDSIRSRGSGPLSLSRLLQYHAMHVIINADCTE
jgi:hypothetical protein